MKPGIQQPLYGDAVLEMEIRGNERVFELHLKTDSVFGQGSRNFHFTAENYWNKLKLDLGNKNRAHLMIFIIYLKYLK